MTLKADLEEYRSAQILLQHDHSHSKLHEKAAEIVSRMGHVQYDVSIPCLLCKESFSMQFPLSQIASWTDKPRGICPNCAHKTNQVISSPGKGEVNG